VFFVLEELMLIPVKLSFLLLGDCFLVVLFVAGEECPVPCMPKVVELRDRSLCTFGGVLGNFIVRLYGWQ
jgi:hypothetical protein